MSRHQPNSTFWRDDALPFIEARAVTDGRRLCYARHSHATFSIGAITEGTCTYFNRAAMHSIGAGTLVLMNPGDAHACNPLDNQPWGYIMLYVDCDWLGRLQHRLGLSPEERFKRLTCIQSQDQALHSALLELHACLTSSQTASSKEQACECFFTRMLQRLDSPDETAKTCHDNIQQAALFIQKHCADSLKLEDICAEAGLSASYLNRAFKQHFGMTPHAYLLDQRVQLARRLLRSGHGLADAALQSGFADQAHFQRAFKQLLATTPGHYKGYAGTSR